MRRAIRLADRNKMSEMSKIRRLLFLIKRFCYQGLFGTEEQLLYM